MPLPFIRVIDPTTGEHREVDQGIHSVSRLILTRHILELGPCAGEAEIRAAAKAAAAEITEFAEFVAMRDGGEPDAITILTRGLQA